MFRHRPAMKWCALFIPGAIIAWHLALPVETLIIVAAFLAAAAALLRGTTRFSTAAVLAECALVLVFGALKTRFDAGAASVDDIARCARTQDTVLLECTVSERPSLSPAGVRLLVEATAIRSRGRTREVTGGVVVSARRRECLPGALLRLVEGRHARFRGVLALPPAPRNPGDFDLREYFRVSGISARFSALGIDEDAIDTLIERSFMMSLVVPVRTNASRAIDLLIGREEGNFLKGLLLGERSTIPPEIRNEFINAGVMHILAVSGLHVAIVSLILLILFQMLRLPRGAAVVAAVVSLIYYNFLTGGTPSVTRSVIMASVFLLGTVLERKTDMYNTLALSALIIMLVDARQLFQAGFQLSFVAVFSLVFLYPKIERLWRPLPENIRTIAWVRWLLAGLTVSVAAGIGTLPFTAMYFGRISIAGFIANLVAVPLSNVILAVGMLAVAIWFCLPWLGAIYAAATGGLTSVFLAVVAWFGTIPHGALNARFDLTGSLLCYAVAGLLLGLGDAARRKISVIGLVVLTTALVWKPLLFPERRVLRVAMIDCGQGDAILLQEPGGRSILVDTGPVTAGWDAGARFIVPFLRWEGIDRLDALIVTHPHSDHNGGGAALLRAIPADRFLDGGESPATGIDTLLEHVVDSLQIPRTILRRGMTITAGSAVRIFVLHPTAMETQPNAGGAFAPNNASIVLKLVYGRTSMLLVGDLERPMEDALTARYDGFLRSDILKSGHHGSATSSSAEFLTAVHPSLALVSVGERNKFGHPSRKVLERYGIMGIAVHRTDREGAQVVESDGRAWQIVHWR